MNSLVADGEFAIRLGVFLGMLATLALLETRWPRRVLSVSRARRWVSNFGISLINTAVLRLILPVAGVGAALLAKEQGWGLFNLLALPSWLAILLFLIVFDLTIYFQHRLFHRVPLLWRLHRMHHTDPDVDLSTGNRFHPLSFLLSGLIKLALVLLLGPPLVAVVLAEVVLNATSMFNHSNLRLPPGLDRALRRVLVTPDMHRIHHSLDDTEHNRNFGFNFSWWDRLFGTYQDQAALPQQTLRLGIEGFQGAGLIRLAAMLVQPWQNPSLPGSAGEASQP